MQGLARFIYFKLLGWKMSGTFPSHLDKFVIIVVPHTSWWDFLLGLLVRKILNEEINYIGKKSLFDSPLGWFFRWTGGAPIDRSKSNDTVSSIVKIFEGRERFRLALSPEGTRKKVQKWKTGFYHIAKQAKVPIVMVAFDYGKKEVKFSKPQIPTENQTEDIEKYESYFNGVNGKVTKT